MVNKCYPIKLSMVLYCGGGLFDPAPALPGQNGDCSQLMDPATTPDYQQAAGTLQCGGEGQKLVKMSISTFYQDGTRLMNPLSVCLLLCLQHFKY